MHFPRELANCGKLYEASVFDGLEFKPHLGGHWDKAHYSRGVLHGARALTSNRMLPQLRLRRAVHTGPEAAEKLYHPARMRYTLRRFQCDLKRR